MAMEDDQSPSKSIAALLVSKMAKGGEFKHGEKVKPRGQEGGADGAQDMDGPIDPDQDAGIDASCEDAMSAIHSKDHAALKDAMHSWMDQYMSKKG